MQRALGIDMTTPPKSQQQIHSPSHQAKPIGPGSQQPAPQPTQLQQHSPNSTESAHPATVQQQQQPQSQPYGQTQPHSQSQAILPVPTVSPVPVPDSHFSPSQDHRLSLTPHRVYRHYPGPGGPAYSDTQGPLSRA
ncbi:protein bassoon isoform X1 [Lates japonicus]|uniref:Protein bassoon isoform X1 n=1 Tax=Lates japonicus TaxID=270547 RepID=A0AAD3RNM6_LATJO|nr:protein bassoon isoform X1 [Lates japonicus]